MSEFFVYDSDDSSYCEPLNQRFESKKGDSAIENGTPKSIHNNILKLPVSHNSSVSSFVNTVSGKS